MAQNQQLKEYIDEQVPISAPEGSKMIKSLNANNAITATAYVMGVQTPPVGGLAGDYLRKKSDTDFDMEWITFPTLDYIPNSEKGAPNGVATLDGNAKVPTSQLPAIVIGETFVVGSQAAMLALPANIGDVAIRTDQGGNKYLLLGEPASVASNWSPMGVTGPVTMVNGQTGIVVLAKGDVGLGNVDNTSDLNKPISNAQATVNASDASRLTALEQADTSIDGRLDAIESVNTAQDGQITALQQKDVAHDNRMNNIDTAITGLANAMIAVENENASQDADIQLLANEIIAQAQKDIQQDTDINSRIPKTEKGAANGVATLDGDGRVPMSQLPGSIVNSFNTRVGAVMPQAGDYDKAMVGLGNVDNTSDANKPVSTAQAAADSLRILLTEKATANGVATLDATGKVPAAQLPSASGVISFNGRAGAVMPQSSDYTKAMVGLGNVDNTTDLNKPVSTATQTQLNLKAPINMPAFTGVPTAPTAGAGTNTTQIATTAFVTNAVAASTAGVSSFKGRTGAVVPVSGDYDKTMVGLANVDNTSDANKPVSTAQAAADALKIDKTEKGAANGVATLGADSKVPTSQLPAIVIGETFTVSSQAAMLALPANIGDVAIRTDQSNMKYMLLGEPATTATNWASMGVTGPVTSVNGQTGIVVLAKSDVGLGNVDNTSDANKPVSTAQATADALKIDKTEKAAANGVATLDATGKVPAAQLPATASGAFIENQNAAAQTANFWINGTGKVGALEVVRTDTSPMITLNNSVGNPFIIGNNPGVSFNGAFGWIDGYQAFSVYAGSVATHFGTQLFVVDAASFRLSVPLQLKSLTVDGATLNGGMFYRSDTGRFRVGTSGVWKDLATTDITVLRSEMGAPNGVATLDGGGRVPMSQLPGSIVNSFNTRVGAVMPQSGDYTKAMVGLDQVDNTSDANKPVSTAQAAADALLIPLTQKAAANGVATLDSGGKVPAAQLPFTSGNFIQNQNAAAQTGDFWISGSGKVNTFETTGNNNGFVPSHVNGFAFAWNRISGTGNSNLIWCATGGSPNALVFEHYDGVAVSTKATLDVSGNFMNEGGLYAKGQVQANLATTHYGDWQSYFDNQIGGMTNFGKPAGPYSAGQHLPIVSINTKGTGQPFALLIMESDGSGAGGPEAYRAFINTDGSAQFINFVSAGKADYWNANQNSIQGLCYEQGFTPTTSHLYIKSLVGYRAIINGDASVSPNDPVQIGGWGTSPIGSEKFHVVGKSAFYETVKLHSATTDLAVANGALFYRSDLNKLRAGINGAWQTVLTETSPALLGTPTATTALLSDNSTRIATTAYVVGKIAGKQDNPQTINVTGPTFNLQSGQNGHVLVSTSATPINIVVSNGGGTIFNGFSVQVWQMGAGEISFSAGAGATLNNRQGFTKLAGQYSGATLTCVGGNGNTWCSQGDMKA